MPRKKKKNPTGIKLLSVSDIALTFSFHPNTVRKWVNQNGLRHYRSPAGKIYIREDDVIDFLLVNYGVEAASEG